MVAGILDGAGTWEPTLNCEGWGTRWRGMAGLEQWRRFRLVD